MKLLLISANTVKTPYPVYPLGLDYVAGAVRETDDVRILDMNDPVDRTSLEETVIRYSPDILGISLRNIDSSEQSDKNGYFGAYLQIIKTIRKLSSAPIVLGGSGFSLFPDELMEALDADYGIVGEGERLPLLLKAIEEGRTDSLGPGILKKGTTATTPPPWEKPFKRDFPHRKLYGGFYIKNSGMLNLQTKRGCNFRCIYCTYPHIEGKVLRFIPPEEVADTAMRLQEIGAKYIFVTDSVFNSDYRHSMAVAEAFIRAGLSIPWGAFFAPTQPPEGYFKLLRRAGLTHAEFGTESLSANMLKTYRKPFIPAHVLQTHHRAVNAGLHVAHYLLLGGPGETRNTVGETLSQLDKLSKSVFFFFCALRIYPHTALYDMAVETGAIVRNQSILQPVFYRPERIHTEEIIHKVKERANNRFNWVIGSGGEMTARIIAKMYSRGHSGPLWEHLISV